MRKKRYINATKLRRDMHSSTAVSKRELFIFDELLNMQPTADVRENVCGEWVLLDEESNTWGCTNCKKIGCDDWWTLNQGTPTENKMRFCPHCGAKMRKEQNGGLI